MNFLWQKFRKNRVKKGEVSVIENYGSKVHLVKLCSIDWLRSTSYSAVKEWSQSWAINIILYWELIIASFLFSFLHFSLYSIKLLPVELFVIGLLQQNLGQILVFRWRQGNLNQRTMMQKWLLKGLPTNFLDFISMIGLQFLVLLFLMGYWMSSLLFTDS